MIPVFSGETANDVWKQAAEKLLFGDEIIIESRAGRTSELLHAIFFIADPRQRWITYRNPSISIAFALAEVVWILNGSNEAQVINFWNPILNRYAGNEEIYHGAYGYRIRERFGIDQLERAYNVLKSNPKSRQAVIMIWNPNDDLPNMDGEPNNSDIPCNICSMLKVRESKLEWTQIIRSNDIFRGVPYNFVQFTMLQEILAGWLELDVGAYTQLSDSLHLYHTDKEVLSISERANIKNYDILNLNKAQSHAIFSDIFERMRIISKRTIDREKLMTLAYLQSGYDAYDNIMLILSAYAAKKMGFADLVIQFINKCTNNLFCQMWDDWDKHYK